MNFSSSLSLSNEISDHQNYDAYKAERLSSLSGKRSSQSLDNQGSGGPKELNALKQIEDDDKHFQRLTNFLKNQNEFNYANDLDNDSDDPTHPIHVTVKILSFVGWICVSISM